MAMRADAAGVEGRGGGMACATPGPSSGGLGRSGPWLTASDRRLVAAALLAYALFAAFATVVMAEAGVAADESGVAPVGLEARGVDVWAAWRSAGRLDVRDALNRPVSPAVLERQMKGALRAAHSEVAAASPLPGSAAVLAALERLAAFAAAVGRAKTRPSPARASSGLPAPGPASPRSRLLPMAASWMALAALLARRGSGAGSLNPAFGGPLPLRC